LMTIPVAVCWTAARARATRVTLAAALAATAFASCALVFVGGGNLAYNVRQTYALWLEWLNGATDLARGMPAWWRGSELLLYRDTAVWLVVFGGAWAVLRGLQGTRALKDRGAFAAVASAAYAVAAMIALTTVWTLADARRVQTAPAQLELLRRIGSERRTLAWLLPDFRRVAADDVPAMLHIEPQPSTAPGGAGANDRPLYQVASVPAGVYRLRPHGADPAGWLMVGIGRDQFSLLSGQVAALPQPLVLRFPVDVRAIVVRGDEQTRRSLRALTIEPVSIVPAAARLAGDYARRAVQYDGTTVFFLDERSFPEPEAFWIGGARQASMVLQPANPQSSVSLLLRNAPVDNRIVLESGKWREEMQLSPGEERRVQVPIDLTRGAALLTVSTTAGFRPSAVDAKSRDDRFLGLWIKIVE
jgi:hypothetical protein